MSKKCQYCDQEFDGRSDQLFCSGNCRTRSFRTKQSTKTSTELNVEALSTLNPVSRQKSDIEVKTALEIKRLEYHHEENVLRLKFQEGEKLRQQEQLEQERKYQHEMDMTELTESREINSLRELLRTKTLQEELLQKQAAQKEVSKLPTQSNESKMDDTPDDEIESDNDSLLKIGMVGLGALLLFKLFDGNSSKPTNPSPNPARPKPKPAKKAGL